MLLRVTGPGEEPITLRPGFAALRGEQTAAPPVVGFGLFDSPSHLLPATGQVEVEIVAPIDGRRYAVRRALDVPEHWRAVDCETGWLAAAGPVDVPRWLRDNLDIPDDLPLPRLFRDIVSFSLPVTVAWLVEEPALRERKLASLLRTERYPAGVRWLDTVLTQVQADQQNLESAVKLREGRDAFYDAIRQRLESTRQRFVQSTDRVSKLRAELERATADKEQLDGWREELADLERELQVRRQVLATLEAEANRWRHWQAVHDRAVRSMQDHRSDWQAYQDACAEISKLAGQLAGQETLRIELQTAAAEAMALRREQTLVQEQLGTIHAVEDAAAELGDAVHEQQQLEQQLRGNQERALRLEVINRSLQPTLADSKRIEVLLAEVERQLSDVEQLGPQAARFKKLQNELEEQQRQAQEAVKQVDHLRFLEAAVRAISGHLDDLRKGTSVTERMSAKTTAGGNGSDRSDDRTVAGHLRDAIVHQVEGLERQLRDWQAQSRDLSDAPGRLNSLRATVHQLEQEIAAARQVEVKLGAVPALKQNRKHLKERFDQLSKTIEAQLKEQQACSDALGRLSQVRQELSALKDPRAERQVLIRAAARKQVIEADLKQVQRKLAEAEARQKALDGQMQALAAARAALAAQELRRDGSHAGYCTYLAHQTVVELAASLQSNLEAAVAKLEEERRLQEQAEARETALLGLIHDIEDTSLRVARLAALLEEAERQAADWKGSYQAATLEQTAAEETRAEMAQRRVELDVRRRAHDLLGTARMTVQEAEVAIGREIRSGLAEAAGAYLRYLIADTEAGLAWNWGEAPVLTTTGASQRLDELNPVMRAYCALSLRLALAAEASRFGTIFVSGLGPLQESEDFSERLERLPGFDQVLVASAW